MKFNFALALPISVPLLFLSTLADAKLIKRGGASDDLGQITPYYIAPLDSGYWLGLGVAGPGVAEFIAFPELVQTDPVPFANRSGKVENRDSLDQCSPAPDVCEYEFLLGERLIVEGHSISFGLAEGVTTSFTWSLYEAKSKVVNNIYGAEIFTWEPTSINYAGVNGQIDVLLNTVFPIDLAPGLYQIGLTSTYTAPSKMEFGYLDEFTTKEKDEDLYRWHASSNTFTTSMSRRYNLTLEVNAPNQLSIFGVIMGLLLCSRMIFKKQPED
jgi:hypothetical protein